MPLVEFEKPQGLRERKRRETRRTLATAAVELTLELGLENVTVEQIAERADVSPRTFFNYFSSKEEALSGPSLEHWEAELLAAFPRSPSGAGVYADVRDFLIGHFQERVLADELLAKRMQVVASTPQLVARRHSQMAALLEKLIQLTAHLLAAEAGEGADPAAPELVAEARMLLYLCGAALNHALHSTLTTGDASRGVAASFELLESTVARHLPSHRPRPSDL